jgi:hypothetical protein
MSFRDSYIYVRAFTLVHIIYIEVTSLILYFKLGFDQVELLHTDIYGKKKTPEFYVGSHITKDKTHLSFMYCLW